MNLTLQERERIAYASGDAEALRQIREAEEMARETLHEEDEIESERLRDELDDAEAARADADNRVAELESGLDLIARRLINHDGPLSGGQVGRLAQLLEDFDRDDVEGAMDEILGA